MRMKLYLLKNNNHLSDNGYSLEEQGVIYNEQLAEVYANPRWYLDNLDYMVEYRVSWQDYRSKRAVLPREYVKKRKV